MTNLLRLMCIPSHIEAVCKTSDGFYLGQVKGDIGFNAFLGKPKEPHLGIGRERMMGVWDSLSSNEREEVLVQAQGLGIDLEGEFGVLVGG